MAESSPRSSAPPSWVLHAVVGLLSLVWGSTYLVIREGLDDLPPFTSAAVRFALASLVMSLLAAGLARREGGARPGWNLILVMGIGNFGVCYGLVYWAETRIDSGLVSVLWATFPMMVAGVGQLWLSGERLRPAQWLGFLIGFLGVVLLFSTDLSRLGSGAIVVGAITLLSPLVGAFGQGWVKLHGPKVSSLLLNRDGMLVGTVVLGTLAVLTERDETANWTPKAIGSVAYLALFGTVLTFSLYYWALRWWPSYRLSLIAYLTPVLALTLGSVVRDEHVGLGTLLGTGLVLSGVGLVIRTTGSRQTGSTGTD